MATRLSDPIMQLCEDVPPRHAGGCRGSLRAMHEPNMAAHTRLMHGIDCIKTVLELHKPHTSVLEMY